MYHFADWRRELEVRTICGIGKGIFHHPPGIGDNEKLLAYLQRWPCSVNANNIYPHGFISGQFCRHGLSSVQISDDDVCTHQDSQNGFNLWWSHKRWFDEGQKGVDGRNGILVIRNR